MKESIQNNKQGQECKLITLTSSCQLLHGLSFNTTLKILAESTG